MSWVTIIWSMVASACLTLAGIHLPVWCRNRTAWTNPALALAAAICFLLAVETHAARSTFRSDPDYLIDAWETEDGLPENSATAMVQTPDGYLWFGTFNGLVRFDGMKFTVFDPANTPQLPGGSILNLHCDRSGRLWVCTSRGLAVWEGGEGQVASGKWRSFGTNNGWAGNYVRTFAERANGDLLMTTFDGHVLEFANGRFAQLPPPGEPGKGYLGCADEAGSWWVAQHQFVGRWDGQRWMQIVLPSTPNSERVGCCAARDGGVWLLMEAELRKYRHGVEVSRVQLPEVPGSLWSMSEDKRGNVWICTSYQGVCRIAPDGGMRRWTTSNGLVSRGTRFVFEDHEGNLWVGTSGGGLQRFKPRRFQSFGVESGLAERVVESLWPDRDGGLWIATQGKGLFRLHDGVVTNVPLPDPHAVILAQSVMTDREGRLWLGTTEDLWCSDKNGFRKIHSDQLSRADIRALFEDSRGRVWIGGAKSAAVLDGESLRSFTAAEGLPAGGAICFAEDSRGVIWLSTFKGVFRWENGGFVEFQDQGQPLRNITCLKADADGTLWMGSVDQGLLCQRDGRLAKIGAEAGLPIRGVNGILEDAAGFFWLTSNRGLVRVPAGALRLAAEGKVAGLDCLALDQHDGLPSVEFAGGTQPTCARDVSGRLWFATLKGVAMIDPAGFRLNTNLPPVRIEELTYRTPASRGARQSGQATTRSNEFEVHLSAPFRQPLRLPAGSHQIEIHYTALSFSAPEKVRFQTQLEGVGHGWDEPHDWRVTRFYELPPGDYVFRVRAANNDGVWNVAGTSLAFTVQPYYWQTVWFRIAVVLVLINTGGVAAWWRSRLKHRRELADLERTRRQQSELAHLSRVTMLGELSGSLAHELNQPLTAILSNAQAAQRFLAHDNVDLDELRDILKDIVDEDKRAGEVIRRLRLLLKKGEVQHQPLDVNEIVLEVLKLVRSDLVNQGVTAQTELAPDLPVIHCDRVQLQQVLLNLVMNACDAMAGAAAGDREFVIRTGLAGDQCVLISVADRGTGVAPEKLEKIFESFFTTKAHGLGLGLSVCRTIITAHGGKLWATNNPTRGATFHFTLTTANGAHP